MRDAGELLPASALVTERNSSQRGCAATGRLGRFYEGIPGFAQAHGMRSFSDQHHDLDVTRGVPLFHVRCVHWVAQRREAAGVSRQDLPPPRQASGAARTRRGRAALTLSCGNLWPVKHESPSLPSRATSATLRRMTHQGRANNNFDPAAAERGRPSRAGVAAALGYCPESVDLSEEVRSTARPPVALCQPTEGASISLSDKDICMFTGVLVVRKAAAGGGMILEDDPAEWLGRAYDKLRERHISPDRRVMSLSTRLSQTMWHPFRWHFGPILERCGQALAEMMLPFTAPLAEHVVFETVSFEVFWPWMLGSIPAAGAPLRSKVDVAGHGGQDVHARHVGRG